MTGILSGIKRSAIHDGSGLRTTVFLKGCPLKCVWCHNPEGISFQKEIGFYEQKCIGCGSCKDICPAGAVTVRSGIPKTDISRCTGCMRCADICPTEARIGYGTEWTVEDLTEKLLQDRIFFQKSGGGVTLSGGECLAQPEFSLALTKRLWEAGIDVDIDTCGYVSRHVLEAIAPYTHTFLYDIKAIDPEVHKRCTGHGNARILSNLEYLCHTGCRVEIRYPYVPGWNDGECEKIGKFLAPLPGITKVKILGYHNFADGKYQALGLKNTLPDVIVYPEDLDIPTALLLSFGLNAVNGMRDD